MLAPYDICRTKDGRLVPHTDLDAALLVVAKGSEIPADEVLAVHAFLNPKEDEPKDEPESKRVASPAVNKRVRKARETK